MKNKVFIYLYDIKIYVIIYVQIEAKIVKNIRCQTHVKLIDQLSSKLYIQKVY